MDTILEHIDPQVVFVIIALLIGGGQALFEQVKKRRAEQEARRELARRGRERTAERTTEHREPPPLQNPFEELYEEYRRSILQDQQRAPGQGEQHSPPWQQPAPAAPPPLPPVGVPAPHAPPVLATVDAEPEPWNEPTLTMAQAWQAPAAAKRAELPPTANEQAAVTAPRGGLTANPVASILPPSKRKSARRNEDWRRAVILREILGPPKSLDRGLP